MAVAVVGNLTPMRESLVQKIFKFTLGGRQVADISEGPYSVRFSQDKPLVSGIHVS